MPELLSLIDLTQYDLFHMRYGKGAVIVAASNKPRLEGQINTDKYVAQVYASGDRNISTTPIPLDPIRNISENDGFIKISIEVKRTYDGKPSYRPISAVIDRIIPVNQVTLEIISINDSA
jgi:hypothetical protein